MARVLVVEDDQDIRTLLEVRLRTAGHRVLGVGSGEEALDVVAERGAPEVLVSDVSMPGLTGLELLARLRDRPDFGQVPAIFLSGRVQPEDIAAGQALGATYLTKPVVLSALCAAIDRALDVRAAAAGSW